MEEPPTTPTLAPPAPAPAFPGGVSSSPPAAATVASPAPLLPPPAAPPQTVPPPDRESRRSGSVGGRMGLTKEVLSAHTQQEEQAFLDRFKDLSKLRVFDQTASSALRCHVPTANPLARGRRHATPHYAHKHLHACAHAQKRAGTHSRFLACTVIPALARRQTRSHSFVLCTV